MIRILREVIRRLKEGKAVRGNGILAQVRKYSLEEVKGEEIATTESSGFQKGFGNDR